MISSTLDTGTVGQDSAMSAIQLLAPSSAFSQPFYSQPFYSNYNNKRAFTSVKVPSPIKATSPLPAPRVKSTSPFQPPSKSPKLAIENSFSAVQLSKSTEEDESDDVLTEKGNGDSSEVGSDKATQTSNVECNDQAMFCTVLCNMLLDRIKDTFHEALQSYGSDAERDMKGLVNQALSKASSDIDKRLSIVSVHSLTQPNTCNTNNNISTLPSASRLVSTAASLATTPSSAMVSTPSTTTAAAAAAALTPAPPSPPLPSDYINRLSFIYGQTRPSMFNPYVATLRSDSVVSPPKSSDGKASTDTTEATNEILFRHKSELKPTTSTPTTGDSPTPTNALPQDEDVNIVDDLDEVQQENQLDVVMGEGVEVAVKEETAASLKPASEGTVKEEESRPSPVKVSSSSPLTPLIEATSPSFSLSSASPLHDKLHTTLAGGRFVDPTVQYELQKLLLSAAIAQQQQQLPSLAPLLAQSKADLASSHTGSDVPVMIPSNNTFYEKREYNCNHCDATFSYGSKLRAHMICVHSIKSYQCRQCRKSFLDKDEYIKHLELHPQRKFPCDKCPSSFDKQHQLSLHYRSHTNEKPYRCQICQRQFAVNDALIRHMRIHTGERPYACQVCGKRFAQKSGLTYHSYLHTGNRPYKCPTCGQGFVHRQALKQHLMKNHLNEQVGRIINSFSPDTTSPQSQSGLAWDKDAMMKAEAIKRAYGWDSKDQQSASSFKLEGLASV